MTDHNSNEVHPPKSVPNGRRRTRILFVITQGELGGAQRYVLDLAANLDRNRYEIVVAIGSGQDTLSKDLGNRGYQVMKVKNLIRDIHPLKDLAAILELKSIIKKMNPDIVHLNSSKAGALGSFAARLAGCRNVIFTAHGFAFLEPNRWLTRQIYFWTEKFASNFRRKIITVSEYDRQAAIKWKLCPPEKLITIHNGISISNSESKPTTYVIGTIARDYPTKDLATLRSAFQILKKDYPQAELKIISVPNAASHLSEFDIYVCSSVKEGFPYSILEAMAAGLPIVTTNVGGIPEAIKNGQEGLLVPPKDPPALAAAIKKLLDNPDLARQLGRAAQKKVQEFSLEKMLAETEAVYEMLANTSSPR